MNPLENKYKEARHTEQRPGRPKSQRASSKGEVPESTLESTALGRIRFETSAFAHFGKSIVFWRLPNSAHSYQST